MSGSTNSGRGGKAYAKNSAQNLQKSQAKNSHNFKHRPPKKVFSKHALEYWQRNMPILKDNANISDKDYDAFVRLCTLYEGWRTCCEHRVTEGITYETKSDRGAFRVIEYPEVKLELQYHNEMMKLERKFGLTPRDGQEVKFKEANSEAANPLSRFQGGL